MLRYASERLVVGFLWTGTMYPTALVQMDSVRN